MTEPRSLSEARKQVVEAEKAAAEEAALYQFFKRHRDVAPNEANAGILRSFLDGVELTAGSLEEAYVILANQEPSPLALRSEQTIQHQDLRERSKLIEKILDTYDALPDWIENERRRLALRNPTGQRDFIHSLDELREILAEREERARLSKLSVEELRQIVKPKLQPEFPPLDPKWTAGIIRASSASVIRGLLQKFGQEQVNRRLLNQD